MKDILQRVAEIPTDQDKQTIPLDGISLRVGKSDKIAASSLILYINQKRESGLVYGVAEAMLIGELIEQIGRALADLKKTGGTRDGAQDFADAVFAPAVRASLDELWWFRFHQCSIENEDAKEVPDGC